ncbi:MAG: hypothetical protein AAGJ97_05595 [Planctomycetota bacterium]
MFVAGLAVSATAAPAQSLPGLPNSPFGGSNGSRLPDDQVEGTVWEYKLKPTKKQDEPAEPRAGKFRLEDSAVFDAAVAVTLPPLEGGLPGVAKKIITGEGLKIELPEAPSQKRIGQYRVLRGTSRKIRIDFDDPESLNGIMVIWPKRGTNDVWMGNYTEKGEGSQRTKYVVELRPILD